MVGGTVFGFLGGLHYWWPKMFGKLYDETQARIAFVLVFIGFNLTFFPQFLLGSHGMPRRYYDYLPHFQSLHVISSIGAYTLLLGFLIMAFMFFRSLTSGKKSPQNPWGSAGYEWQTASPPIEHNFHHQPVMERGPYDYHLATEAELFEGYEHERTGAALFDHGHGHEAVSHAAKHDDEKGKFGGSATGPAALAASDQEEDAPAKAAAKEEEE
jgi:cytochrome c oxidase subunit 1